MFVRAGEQEASYWMEDQSIGLLLQDNTFMNSAGAAVFLEGASATLSGNAYTGNTFDLVQQACTGADSPPGLDDEPIQTSNLCPAYDYWTQDLTLEAYFREAEITP